MQLASADIYDRVSKATARLQDDGGVFRRFIERHQLDRTEFWLAARFRYFPGSATPHDFSTFGPYTSVSIYRSALDRLVDKRLAERAGEARYRLTEPARKALADTYTEYFGRVARSSALLDEDADRLFGITESAYAAALRQSDVPVPILNAAHSILPEIDSVWVQLERRLVGLMIFRDDAHIAAWREAGYTGPRIELSTQLFHKEEGLAYEELRAKADRLDDKDFASALSALHSGGEVSQRAEKYRLSKAGRATRQEIEDATNLHFEKPFASLPDDDLKTMLDLMNLLAQ